MIGLRLWLRPDMMVKGDRGVARRAKPVGFGAVSLGFASDNPPFGWGASPKAISAFKERGKREQKGILIYNADKKVRLR